jgi:hypothetical protein
MHPACQRCFDAAQAGLTVLQIRWRRLEQQVGFDGLHHLKGRQAGLSPTRVPSHSTSPALEVYNLADIEASGAGWSLMAWLNRSDAGRIGDANQDQIQSKPAIEPVSLVGKEFQEPPAYVASPDQ